MAFGASLAIGVAFGAVLERAGFGSSRRLSAIFYFRDMTVLKVMFSAVLVAMLGLGYLTHAGMIDENSISLPDTVYGAQIVGGLIFGIGFVMSGWCPGTAAVGLASGRLDALLFLIGATLGSVLFNETFEHVKPLYTLGQSGTVYIFDTLGITKGAFALLFTAAGVAAFWFSELIEARMGTPGMNRRAASLWVFSFLALFAAAVLYGLPPRARVAPATAVACSVRAPAAASPADLRQHFESMETGLDHISADILADRMMAGEPGLLVVDIRSRDEFERFSLRGSVNIPLPELAGRLDTLAAARTVVICSLGMTHAAQARDAVARAGIPNAFLLTDGLEGFIRTCLKPASLRSEPVSESVRQRIQAWRNHFYEKPAVPSPTVVSPARSTDDMKPGLISTEQLAQLLSSSGVRVIDTRPQPEYNTSHIPGSLALNPESLRGVRGGVPSMLLPADLLARQFGAMGIVPETHVVIVHGEKLHDATLVAIALERLGHTRYSILDGGWTRWKSEHRPADAALPRVGEVVYPVSADADTFTREATAVLEAIRTPGTTIIDVRPADFYAGEASDEARAGHVPGARNRPFSSDLASGTVGTSFKSLTDLAEAYRRVAGDKHAPLIVHCRTGHQASQTWFVLRRLLGYENVGWYDGGWTEWAARPEFPIETGSK
ncbi:YeeE/YedE family protein [Candidatus Ozemobacteraceae bacterium]|nr:YeeE/YedE family protein [Candidatus Ozemobacteraceae bacterium]